MVYLSMFKKNPLIACNFLQKHERRTCITCGVRSLVITNNAFVFFIDRYRYQLVDRDFAGAVLPYATTFPGLCVGGNGRANLDEPTFSYDDARGGGERKILIAFVS